MKRKITLHKPRYSWKERDLALARERLGQWMAPEHIDRTMSTPMKDLDNRSPEKAVVDGEIAKVLKVFEFMRTVLNK